ncbi:adenine phosphoribosyltransferase [Cellulosilyticum sp. ST5]|uniref:Adenine phosphoribosyltransferase n=1 Tax=Cellulosilyticum lentocellum (strain ATCC 49066 / DSM 5427 / NCIMB 11756 / RHM5) TaxID=642492 RepID=F2JHL2_CELLD|nr:adenine phosphoribosyltransferase [Cellulosilyticum lentocellum]ADZ84251.1 adenine phosphoribosyltransferase [Cellulosilyticum lentocellum DSM 5427]
MNLYALVRDVKDFPKEGILFKDITTLLQDGEGLSESIDQIAAHLENVEFDSVVGPEARGFIFGVPTAYKLKKGFIPVRKPGKLPYQCVSQTYDLEYGSSTIEMHIDAIQKGQKVVIVDDLLATGGTTKAMIDLIERMGGEVVKIVFLIELEFLKGRELLKGYEIESILKY